MGRYYSGDIDGKFWFGVQPTDDAENFGAERSVRGKESSYVDYYIKDIKLVEKGIKECLKPLGEYKEVMDKYFEECNGYNHYELAKILPKERIKELLMYYARLELGEKIKKCIEENGDCSFEAEC